MKRSLLDRAAWAVAGALAVAVIASYAGVVRSGPLDPGGAPSSTLPQVEPRIPIRQPATPAGFPITISAPGSYFLTQNITASAATDGIVISADGVALDLNGFVLSGASIGSAGISAAGANHVTISNGVIRDWTGAGIKGDAITNGRYEKLQISGNHGGGIIAGKDSLVADCQVTDNGGNGIAVVQPLTFGSSSISGCTVDGSVLDGIVVDNNVTVTGNSVTNSGVDGIHAFLAGNRIDGNHIGSSAGKEIHVEAGGNVIVRNSFSGGASDLSIVLAGNTQGPTENGGTPISNPWANLAY